MQETESGIITGAVLHGEQPYTRYWIVADAKQENIVLHLANQAEFEQWQKTDLGQ